MPAIDFFGPPARDEQGRPFGTSRLVNCYLAPGERSAAIARPVPGMRAAGSLGGIFCRSLETLNAELYAVQGGELSRLSSTGARTVLMPVADDEETSLSGLEGHFCVTAGGVLKVFTPALAASTPALTFDAASSAIVLNRRVLITERNGRRFQWSAVGDPTSLPSLNYATAEQTDETLVRAYEVNGEAWLFKAGSIERWAATGSGSETSAFGYIPGSLMQPGLKGYGLICKADMGAFFVGSDGRAYLAGGGAIQAVSEPGGPVEASIVGATPVACFRSRYESREILHIRFSDRPTWSLDVALGQWHERAQGADLGPWEAVAGAECYGASWAGTDAGGLYALDAVGVDGTDPLHRVMVSTTLQQERRPFRVPRLEIQAHVGRGSVTADRSRPPQVRLRTSRDFGLTWADRPPRSLGEEGQYSVRPLWRALGQFRAFTAELSCAEPLDIGFDSTAFVEIG